MDTETLSQQLGSSSISIDVVQINPNGCRIYSPKPTLCLKKGFPTSFIVQISQTSPLFKNLEEFKKVAVGYDVVCEKTNSLRSKTALREFCPFGLHQTIKNGKLQSSIGTVEFDMMLLSTELGKGNVSLTVETDSDVLARRSVPFEVTE